MGWVTYPIPDGWSWKGSTTGRPWTTTGSGLTLHRWEGPVPEVTWDVTAWDEHVWADSGVPQAKLELQPVFEVPIWVDYTERLLDVQLRTGVDNWYLGPRPGRAQFILDMQDNFALNQPRPLLGVPARLSVTLNSGQVVPLWFGFVNRLQDNLTAGALPTLTVGCHDLIGQAFQAASPGDGTPNPGPADATAHYQLYVFMNDPALGRIPASYLTKISQLVHDDTGASGMEMLSWAGSSTEVLSAQFGIQTLVRSEQGLLYTDPTGQLRFLTFGWWRGRGVAANIGSGTPPSVAQYQFPASQVDPIEATQDVFTQLKVDTFNQVGTVISTYTAKSLTSLEDRFGVRARSDRWKINDLGPRSSNLSGTVVNLHTMLETFGRRIQRVTFPADKADAQLFAARVEPGAKVQVRLEGLPENDADFDDWQTIWVTAVEHRLSPTRGWQCILTGDSRLVQDRDFVPTYTP